jgi:ribonuclease HI
VIHAYVDGSFMPGSGRAGIGVVITLGHDKAVCWGKPVQATTSMQAEMQAAESALAWFTPGADVVLVCDNAATVAALARRPTLTAHLGCVLLTYQHDSRLWPMQRAHTLAQQAAAGEHIEQHTVRRAGMPRVVVRPTRSA